MKLLLCCLCCLNFSSIIIAQNLATMPISALDSLGAWYQAKGDYQQALPYRQQALTNAQKTARDTTYAKAVQNLANLYRLMGQYETSEPLFKEAIELRKQLLGEKHVDYARSLNGLAALYKDMRQYEDAEPLFRQALLIFKAALGEKHTYYTATLSNLATLYSNMNQKSLAEPLFIQTIAIRKELLGDKHPEYANSLNNLATMYADMQRYEQADSLFKLSLSIRKAALGEKHPLYAGSLNNLAQFYVKLKRYRAAEPLFKQAMAIRKEVLGARHPSYAVSLNDLAMLCFQLGRYKDAWNYTQQELEANTGRAFSLMMNQAWADSLAVVEYASVEGIMNNLNNIYRLLSVEKTDANQEKQLWVADLAMRLLKRSRDDFSGTEDKLRILSENTDWMLRSLRVLDNRQAEKAFLLAEQNKSVLLMDAVQTERAYSFGDLPDSLIQREKKLQQQQAQLKANLLEKRPKQEADSLLSLLNRTNLDIQAFKQMIEKQFPKYNALKYQSNETNIREIQQLLDNKTALLEYVVGDSDNVYLFYIDKQQMYWLKCPLLLDSLTLEIRKLHHLLSDYNQLRSNPKGVYRDYTNTAHWFYQQLLAPALVYAKGVEQLVIITDGELGHLPFETFLVEAAPENGSYKNLHYLLKDYAISYNYSATLWKENKTSKKQQHNGQLLAMAANYGTANTEASNRLPAYRKLRGLLEDLPAARVEVETLAKDFAGYFAFDKAASERNFKAKAAQFGIIHLAVHGILNQKAPVLSSLALTEDGDSIENNFLQVFEISKMQLNADLVVLSACETGFGKFEKGNGVASLARAFAYAGVPSLVVSLWSVNDQSTSFLMQIFYKNLSEGRAVAEALRQAKLHYLEQSEELAAHPAFWSPFIQLGNSQVVHLQINSIFSWTWILVGIGSLGILAAVFWYWKRQ